MFDHFKQGPFRIARSLILASASPRRQRLLAGLGLEFEVRPSSLREPLPDPGVSPERYARDTARFKAKNAGKDRKDGVILGADTIVVLDGEILGKPKDKKDALAMLSALSGKTHEVITACCLLDSKSDEEETFAVKTFVTMGAQDTATLRAYIDSGEPMDKAGSYAIQGSGCFLVSTIQGSYSNVIGLPIPETLGALLKLKAVALVSFASGKADT